MSVDPGFRSERVVTVDLALPGVRYPDPPKRVDFFRTLLSEVSALPLFERPLADIRSVNPDFFPAMGIELRAGMLLSEADRDGRTAVVSALLAERAWPDQQPLGKQFRIGSPQSPEYEVVGVVGDVRGASLSGNLQFPTVYVPYWRRAFSEVTIAVKTTGDPAAAYALVRQTIRRLDSELPIPAMRTMDDVVTASVAPRQFQMRLVLLFGVVAMLLAGLGVYGVVSYSVAQRTSELGLRMALGATPRTVARSVVQQAMMPVAVGLGAGLVAAVGAGRAVRAMLFDVSPLDPMTLLSVSCVLLTVGAVACYVPARRKMRVGPLSALRTE